MLLFVFLFFFKFFDGKNCSSSATSGKLFKAEKIRDYTRNQFKISIKGEKKFIETIKTHVSKYKNCTYWGVTTTIFDVGEALIKFLELPSQFCLIVVADIKTPSVNFEKLPSERVIFLSVLLQQNLENRIQFVKLIPWNSFGRKNIGYMFAIAAKAKAIWDMDDDNILISKHHILHALNVRTNNNYNFFISNGSVINPMPLFKNYSDNYLWPRGLPLEVIKTKHIFSKTKKPEKILIWQSLANNDPDVDAIFRLTKNHKIFFDDEKALVLASTQFSPMNAQSCLFFNQSFLALFLPFSVPGRVSDIWRGYIAQALLFGIPGNIVLSSPLVIQNRNAHNYLEDFMAEKDLYEKSGALLNLLTTFLNYKKSFTIFDIYVELYEKGFVELIDVEAVYLWNFYLNLILKM